MLHPLRILLIVLVVVSTLAGCTPNQPDPYQLQVWQNSRRVRMQGNTVELRKGPFELYFIVPDFPPDTGRVVMFDYAGGFDAASVYAVNEASTVADVAGQQAQRTLPDKAIADRLVLGVDQYATLIMNNPKNEHNFSGFRKEANRIVLEYRLLGVSDDRLGELKFQDLTAAEGALLFSMQEAAADGTPQVLKSEKLFIKFKQ